MIWKLTSHEDSSIAQEMQLMVSSKTQQKCQKVHEFQID